MGVAHSRTLLRTAAESNARVTTAGAGKGKMIQVVANEKAPEIFLKM